MKIAVIGASGTIGKAVVESLKNEHTIVTLGTSQSDIQLDITDRESVREAFAKMGQVDAIVSAVGAVSFKPFGEYTEDDWNLSLQHKLMGQIRIAEEGTQYLSSGGSITLTSGITSDFPIHYGTSATTVGGAIEFFAKSAALEAPNGIRINVVSPTVLTESAAVYGQYFPGFLSIPAAQVATYYQRSIFGLENGHIFKCFAGNS
ncbi:short chain dehydrogenase [Vibrio caribbeanicus]|uniref:short chain dehydrogenase n=1 Tax=Vibrio caribbeanicus TaxID=701175 RepID=UPI0030DDA682